MKTLSFLLPLLVLLGVPLSLAAQDLLRMDAITVFYKADLLPHTAYFVDSDGSVMVEDLPLRDSEIKPVTGRGVFIFNKDVFGSSSS